MNAWQVMEALGEIDGALVQEAAEYSPKRQERKKSRVLAGAVGLAAALCLAAGALWSAPGGTGRQEAEGGGVPYTEQSAREELCAEELSLFAPQEVVQQIMRDIPQSEAAEWAGEADARFDFDAVLPVYSTIGLNGSSDSLLSALRFEGAYSLSVLSGGRCLGRATVVRHGGKWVVAEFLIGYDLAAAVEQNRQADCYVVLAQWNGAAGFLSGAGAEETFAFAEDLPGYYAPCRAGDEMAGPALLELLKEEAQSAVGDAEG